ncbi:MAG TPA: MBL fold metallo-hydrolase [Methanocella sp.]|uniref:MBL fold metallo-hydrolase n=1 Tax=Methanocella sp. TaxID=2052833 RepID=UPI002BB3795D|nr:MBL fold metallo-hydrolase [Methanocella sp.]HTY90266.1 MBL fold metallo-hydrolase [Methanocella sp.]
MKLKWLGHSCFLLTSSKGVRVLMDPYDEMIGKAVPDTEADIVTVSHQHGDHNYVKAVKGPYTLVDKTGTFKKGGIEIKGIQTAHDASGGSQRGKNIIFKVDIDGISVCHCGDLGHLLTAEQVKDIGRVDVLLLPVGGFFTIDAKTAAEVGKQLKSPVIIPMHYNTGGIKLPIKGVEPFIEAMGGAKKLGTSEVELDAGGLSRHSGAVILSLE